MQLSRFLLLVAFALLPVCLVSTTWLYLYPLFHGCHFPAPELSVNSTSALPKRAPFRLLALGDPQLEGDSSLPKPDALAFPSLRYVASDLTRAETWSRRRSILHDAFTQALRKDLPAWLEGHRKRIDLWGNDLYLAHIARQLRWWTQPSHVAVLGDLLGSQWISDDEFARRADRYWNTVFAGMERVPDAIMEDAEEQGRKYGGTTEKLGEDKTWENRIINIAGNHDIGYAGDLDEKRVLRFEKAFGKVHWDIVFKLPRTHTDPTDEHDAREADAEPPALRLVILNSMNLDTPALSEALQHETYNFMNHVITTARPVTDKTHATILLTHIPLHKEPGICVDNPFFDFFEGGSGVKEQNMLSDYASKMMLEGIFGLSGNPAAEGGGFGRRGIIINGHDHAGCDVVHYVSKTPVSCVPEFLANDAQLENEIADLGMYANTTEAIETPEDSDTPVIPEWHTLRLPTSPSFPEHPQAQTELGDCLPDKETPSIREITLRSMMGDYSGYAGFLSAWFDESLGDHGEWRLEFATCGVGVQHWWWAVHIIDLIALVALVAGVMALTVKSLGGKQEDIKQMKAETKITKVEKPVPKKR